MPCHVCPAVLDVAFAHGCLHMRVTKTCDRNADYYEGTSMRTVRKALRSLLFLWYFRRAPLLDLHREASLSSFAFMCDDWARESL